MEISKQIFVVWYFLCFIQTQRNALQKLADLIVLYFKPTHTAGILSLQLPE